jgi:ABC-2 type transport system permease protein
MNAVVLIALKEIKQRMLNRSFLFMLFLVPLMIISMVYFLVKAADEGKKNVHVLIADPGDILQGVISSKESPNVNYSFVSDYLEIDEFKNGKRYQEFDVLLELNEKVLNNKKVFVFYRDYISSPIQGAIRYTFERRVEEVLISEFSDLSIDEFRQLKQPLNMDFRSIHNPTNSKANNAGWVGYFFGAIIMLVTLFYGLSILRGIAKEKAERVVEVVVSIVRPSQLMLGKIIGIGAAAIIQIGFWVLFVFTGLYALQDLLFSDFFIDQSLTGAQVSDGAGEILQSEFNRIRNNEMIHLIYDRINLSLLLPFFFLFFGVGYLFYGAFFSLIGAAMGSEGDGQLFILPMIFIVVFTLFAGYLSLSNPESDLANYAQFIPFTLPMFVMIKLSMGYAVGSGYLIWISLLIMIFSIILMLWIASRIFKVSLLSYGHRLSLRGLFKWFLSK